MTESKLQTAIASCAVGLARHLMAKESLPQDLAYRKLYATETFKLLSNPDTRLCLESNDYLANCLDIEMTQGIDALYEVIKPDPDM